jgi:hypothetical protein
LCTKRESLQKNELEEGHDRTRGGKGREREKGRKREREKERKREREKEGTNPIHSLLWPVGDLSFGVSQSKTGMEAKKDICETVKLKRLTSEYAMLK